MKLRNLYAVITMLCAPFMAKAGLEELKTALDQAERVLQAAVSNAEGYILVSGKHFRRKGHEAEAYAALQAAEKAEERLNSARAAYNAALQEHNKQTIEMHQMLTIINQSDNDDEEDRFDQAMAMMQQENTTVTLTWDDGRETDLFGVLQVSNDGAVTFAGKPADQISNTQK